MLLCVLAIATPAYSAEWLAIDNDIELDMQDFQKRYNKGKTYIGAWTRIVENGRAKHQNLRWYNCKDKTMSYLPSSSISFDNQGRLKPNETRQRQLSDLQFIDIPPDTVSEIVYDISCTTSLIKDFDNGIDVDILIRDYHESQFITFQETLLQKLNQK